MVCGQKLDETQQRQHNRSGDEGENDLFLMWISVPSCEVVPHRCYCTPTGENPARITLLSTDKTKGRQNSRLATRSL